MLDANPAAGRLVGQPPAEVVGQPVAELLPSWSTTVTAAMAAGVDQASEEVDQDGRIYDLAISALPDRQRQPGGHLVVARDVTERRQVEERLCAALNHERVATDRLEVALERRAGRGRAPAHPRRAQERVPPGRLDLRTPLASVLGISSPSSGAGPAGRGRHRRPHRPAHRQRPQAGPHPHRPARPRQAGPGHRRAAARTGRPGPAGRRRGLRGPRRAARHPTRSASSCSVQVLADAAKVERIVENLLANAARTPTRARPSGCGSPSATGALLCVDDAGPASRPSSGSRSSGRSARPRRHHLDPGTGVGLALVAQIASLHDGLAWVEDRAGAARRSGSCCRGNGRG